MTIRPADILRLIATRQLCGLKLTDQPQVMGKFTHIVNQSCTFDVENSNDTIMLHISEIESIAYTVVLTNY